MPESTPSPVSPFADSAFLAEFRLVAGSAGKMSFERFMQLALYHPQFGYYRRDRTRVGYAPGTDFFTASQSTLFAELVVAASTTLLKPHEASDFTFVEIGAESDAGILGGRPHPFGAAKVFRVDEPLELDGPCVVFSNELFDAQPFRRFVFKNGLWRELGVALQDGSLVEVIFADGPFTSLFPALPEVAPEGYQIDLALAAAELAKRIAAQSWSGLFIAFDYGLSWRELTEARPAGTARAYFRHTQSNDLLVRPGERDLTCHVCWDFLSDALQRCGFPAPLVESQEAFFVRHASELIAATMATEASRLSPRKLSLMQLLHPTHLGQKFQVLWARRESDFPRQIA